LTSKIVNRPQAPDRPQWLHEIKFDGYRMHARLDRGAVRLLTRTGLDWTHKYPPIATAVSSIEADQAYLDGELCGVGPDGIVGCSTRVAALPELSPFRVAAVSSSASSSETRAAAVNSRRGAADRWPDSRWN
jgi:ATP dependent DNA ligase domain